MVAALVEVHSFHEKAIPWLRDARERKFELLIASHTIAELYAVLTTLPVHPRISPRIAWRLIHENIEGTATIVSLSATDYSSILKRMAAAGLSGGIIYDALVVRVAQKTKVERLVTFNRRHFQQLCNEDDIILLSP